MSLLESSDWRESKQYVRHKGSEKEMLNTKFSEEELTEICELMRNHGTNCAVLVDILKLAYRAYPDDAMNTFRHVRLLKEFGVIEDRDLLCYTCVHEVIEHHANTCKEYKKREFSICPEDHYDYSKCEPAMWMTDFWKIRSLTKDKDWNEIVAVLQETFPDMPEEMLHNHPHFLCEKHIGSMKPYANKIMGYK